MKRERTIMQILVRNTPLVSRSFPARSCWFAKADPGPRTKIAKPRAVFFAFCVAFQRRSVHYWNFNYYEWMAKNLGLTGTLKWSLRFTALEHIIPGMLLRFFNMI